MLVFLIASVTAAGGSYLIGKRLETATSMTLDSAVLAVQQIPVGPADPAIVAGVQVAVGDFVHAGQTLAQITIANSAAEESVEDSVLTAPADGVIVAVNAPTGSVVKAGEPVITEYSSASLTFHSPVPVPRAQKLRIGMRVSVDGPGLSAPISAIVGRAQANLSGGSPNTVELTMIPSRLSDVRDLLPGLAFRATIKLTGYPPDAPSVLNDGR